ncbi:MAG: phosphohistidine phosphatase SixA [Chloroflexi bacterium]|nr:phosphohistidine phosphatase SixA [Chloroflexota bacterium]
MKIYLIRHSNAVDPGTSGNEDDSLRPLTEKGRDKMKEIALSLKALELKPDLIVSSPYIRARETAEILAKVLKYRKELLFNDALVPTGAADDIIGEINEKYSVDELVLVGHEPCLSSLAGTLIAENPNLGIELKKGGVCCLSVDNLRTERKAFLEWLLTPKILTGLS